MLTTCQWTRISKPLPCSFFEVLHMGVRFVTYRSNDVAQWVEQQIDNLWVAGSNPAINGPAKAN